jgi:hypothetical protein
MTMLDEGTYRARALDAALGETSKGTEQVGVQFELLDHPGTSITWWGYFSDKTMASTIKALRTCGWEGADLEDLSGIEKNEVQLVIQHETDDKGVTRAKVRWVNGTGGVAMANAMAPDKAKSFAQRMKGQIVAMDKATNGGGGNGSKTTPAPRRTTSKPPASAAGPHDDVPPPDDEIGF